MTGRGKRLALAATAVAVTLTPVTAAYARPVAHSSTAVQDPVRALDRLALPLLSAEPGTGTADLRGLGAAIGDAKVVGFGEATHGSHEFFAMKDRVFRYLVEQKGFTTFALEMSWSAGLRIDDYLQGVDKRDARQVVHDVMAESPWDREEFVTLVQWMRDYNRKHPDRPVHFLGDDVGAPKLDGRVFDTVTDYVRRNAPESLPRLTGLLTGLRPLDDAFAYLKRPVAERQQMAARAQQVLDLMGSQNYSGKRDFAFALQNARNIAQTYRFLTIDPRDQTSLAAAQRYRDQVMADTTVWWQRHTDGKVLMSAHNTHAGYVADDLKSYPKTQGSFLRDALGADYLAVGTTFDQGSFLSKDQALGGEWKKFTVAPAGPGSNEYTLDRVRHRDYYADLRELPAAARGWMDARRPGYSFGTLYPGPATPRVTVGRSFDVLVHLHSVREARKL
ncbi:erythromycin esterase family protein [Streptomyces violascens]|uniref:erythromycin esterase family protein n=1 Tax=Streptomyces violascens TaxID=67381 RepID=UPI00167242A2|nr:erythromycin esterase family protein [Streptomyces violascens]GGT85331.1 succinoglycan biosynthesis protein [Streptomyces violascens]